MVDTDSFCEFKSSCDRSSWTFGQRSTGKMIGPGYGDPSGDHAVKRCPLCNKRLKLKAQYCIGGEFVNWALPDHKPRVTRSKSPKRKTNKTRRGA